MNITTQRSNLDAVVRSAVTPMERPTVPNADTASKINARTFS